MRLIDQAAEKARLLGGFGGGQLRRFGFVAGLLLQPFVEGFAGLAGAFLFVGELAFA